jgi:glutathione peroxidase
LPKSGTRKKRRLNKNGNSYDKKNIYQFKVEDLSGNTFDFASLKGKNNDCKHGCKMWTDSTIQRLRSTYKQYQDKDFVIVGFLQITSRTWQQMKKLLLCQMNYGVTFQ